MSLKAFKSLRKLILILLSIAVLSCGNQDKEVVKYPNGEIKYEVTLKDGLREGKLTEYFVGGKVSAISNWKASKLEGESIVYYENGNINQQNFFKGGVRCCESKFYLEGGILREIQYFNNTGQLIDYVKLNADGSKDLDINTRMVLFIGGVDTVNIGEFYEAKIRLGNRQYNSIEAILGDPKDKFILTKEKLPKLDSITVLLRVKAIKFGSNKIEGVVVDIDADDRSEMVIVPFNKNYYVRDKFSDI